MNARDVVPRHLEHFLTALSEIKNGPELDMEHVTQLFKDLKFPRSGQAWAHLAAPELTPALMPYQVLVCMTASPNHVSRKVNVLEYKILDTAQSSAEAPYFPLFYSVFPNGRRVLGVSGLLLDSTGSTTSYEAGSLAEDKFLVQNPQVLGIFRHLIKLFPSGDAGLEACRSAALADLTALGVVD